MRIGIDARMMGSQQAGLGRYVEQLVLGLVEVDKDNEYVLFVRANTPLVGGSSRPEVRDGGIIENETPPPLLRKVASPTRGGVTLVKTDIPWYSWQEQIKFKKIIDSENIDLIHFPHWNVPLFYNKPFVVTVHDLIMYHYPRQEASTHGPIVYWFKDLMHRLVLGHAVRKAKQIIVTSEFTKQDVHKTLGVPLEKMVVIYQAPFERNKEQGTMNKSELLSKFNINKKYILYVGNAYPHKNLAGLLKAWKIFVEKYGEDYQLVLVGKNNFFYKNLQSEICNLQSVIYTGYLPDSELNEVYEHASLYVFPSLYEGFGLPPLEAQTYGVPVVSSNASCLPEILGESALYFDPENLEQMAEVIYSGLTDENLRFELQKNARENLKRFGWKKLVRETLDIYKLYS